MVRISAHRIPTQKRRIAAYIIHYAIRVPHLAWRGVSLGFLRRRPFPKTVLKILVLRPDGIGDLTMSLPAIGALRDRFPQAEWTLVAGSPSRGLVDHLPWIDRAWFLDLPWAQRSVERLDWGAMWAMLRRIRRERFDLVIDLRGDFRNILWMVFMGSGYRVGYGWSGCGFLLDLEIPAGRDRHHVEHALDCVRALGGTVGPVRFGLEIPREALARARERLSALGVGGDGYLVLHPGAQWPGRQWTAPGYAEVADRAAGQFGLKVLLTGVDRERALSRDIQARMRTKPVDLVGRLTLEEYLAVLRGARLFLGVDSGPMHLAVALAVPTVALFGPGDPTAIGPYGEHTVVVSEAARFGCSPCAQDGCEWEGASCMQAIPVERAWEAVERQLVGAAAGGDENPLCAEK